MALTLWPLRLAPLRGAWLAAGPALLAGSLSGGVTSSGGPLVVLSTAVLVAVLTGSLARALFSRSVRRPGLWLGAFVGLALLQASFFLTILTKHPPLGFLVAGWGALLTIGVVFVLALSHDLVDVVLARIGRGEVPGVLLRPRGEKVEVVEIREAGTFRESAERVLAVVEQAH